MIQAQLRKDAGHEKKKPLRDGNPESGKHKNTINIISGKDVFVNGNKHNHCYQVELQGLTVQRAVRICKLSDLEAVSL